MTYQRVQDSPNFIDSPWLLELIRQLGPLHAEHWGKPVRLNDRIRVSWVWFPKTGLGTLTNHHLRIDRVQGKWYVAAGHHSNKDIKSTYVEAIIQSDKVPSDQLIRAVLVEAELLEA